MGNAYYQIVNKLIDTLNQNYWLPMWNLLEEKPELKNGFTDFLLNPEKIIVYLGKTHWAIEYVGQPKLRNLSAKHKVGIELKDFSISHSDNLLSEIVGIDFNNQGFPMPLLSYNENLVYPTNDAIDLLSDNGWNFAGQSMIMSINAGELFPSVGESHRLVNSFFYGTDSNGLIVRNIKWLDIFPLEIFDVDENTDEFNFSLWEDLPSRYIKDIAYEYPMPDDYQLTKFSQLNRFVELISSNKTKEVEITKFLELPENQFILKMAFFGKEVHSERECQWQSEERKPIRPDFFVVDPNNYANIVEFKLPELKGSPTVGSINRETFNAQIHSYIAQTGVYEEYFEDPNNREYVKEKYGINVRYPKRILVIGRRWMFDYTEWKRIEHEFRNITIRTFDDLIDGVLSQLYS